MGPFLQLLVVVLAMAAGTTIFGSLPLVLPLARAKLRYVELIGSGLLLGASFTVVIPEGVATVLRAADALRRLPVSVPSPDASSGASGSSSGSEVAASTGLLQARGWAVSHQAPPPSPQPPAQSPVWRLVTDGETVVGSMLLLGFFLMFVLEQISSRADSDHHHNHHHHHHHHHHPRQHHHAHSSPTTPSLASSHGRQASLALLPRASTPVATSSQGHVHARSPLLSGHQHTQSYSSGHESLPDEPTSDAGPGARLESGRKPASRPQSALAAHAPHSSHPEETASKSRRASTHARSHRHLSDAGGCAPETSVMVGHSHRLSTLVPPHAPGTSLKTALASIVGLMIHALADGIAMGASASSTDEQLRWIVFGAILIHKAPTAFGLCSVLMARGLSKPDTLKALALFSICTPVGAIVVYLVLQVLFNLNEYLSSLAALAEGAASSAATIRQLGIGATLTFSGGTFLFVAMHALEDVTDSPGPDAGVGAEVLVGPSTPAGPKGKSAQSFHHDHSHDLHDDDTALHSPPMHRGDVEHDAERWDVSDGRRWRQRALSSSSESSMSSMGGSVVREKSIAQEQVESVPQPARIALVFLGCLVPRLLQLIAGDHHH